MKKITSALILTLILAQRCLAGGGTFEAEIIDLIPKEKNEYQLVLHQYTNPDSGQTYEAPKELKIHLRFHPEAFGEPLPEYASKSDYLECIEKLTEQQQTGGRFRFGVMASGFAPIEGQEGHFQSNTLSYVQEYKGTYAIYSFETKI